MQSPYMNREGEEGPVPFRSDRFFCVAGKWHFTTREGVEIGPFSSRERAQEGLKAYIRIARKLASMQS
ncbi:DUF6316 family protein [Hahella sp. SMD15-11]|uniref:DUF6316 family protein n=1 Tax=Thermohahella caldifontis TaxID=3142973 RepID=A0AB39V138_9GAMM